jgi:hypothetical protein
LAQQHRRNGYEDRKTGEGFVVTGPTFIETLFDILSNVANNLNLFCR